MNVACKKQDSDKFSKMLLYRKFAVIENDFCPPGVAQWIEHRPANQRVASSIPSQGTCLGCRPGPWYGAAMFLSLFLPPFPLPKNK